MRTRTARGGKAGGLSTLNRKVVTEEHEQAQDRQRKRRRQREQQAGEVNTTQPMVVYILRLGMTSRVL